MNVNEWRRWGDNGDGGDKFKNLEMFATQVDRLRKPIPLTNIPLISIIPLSPFT
jgi:hypothetical protein